MQLICQDSDIKAFVSSSWPERQTFRLILLDDDRAIVVDYPYTASSFPIGTVSGMKHFVEQIDVASDTIVSAMSVMVSADSLVIFDIQSES